MKSILLLTLFVFSLSATENIAKYDISMKMLGEIGHTTLTLKTTESHYDIVMHLQMDKTLSDVEHRYQSVGVIDHGVYKPEYFVKFIREGDHEETNYYVFDHEKKQIQKYTRIKEDKALLVSIFSSEKQTVTETSELITGDSFAANDTLSTFLNAEKLLNGKTKMKVTSVGFRKNERNIALHKTEDTYELSIVDKEEKDDYKILVSIDPDGLIKEIFIEEYTMLGMISIARN